MRCNTKYELLHLQKCPNAGEGGHKHQKAGSAALSGGTDTTSSQVPNYEPSALQLSFSNPPALPVLFNTFSANGAKSKSGLPPRHLVVIQ
jgi:hypothetical protein